MVMRRYLVLIIEVSTGKLLFEKSYEYEEDGIFLLEMQSRLSTRMDALLNRHFSGYLLDLKSAGLVKSITQDGRTEEHVR